jgi:hypothetical protein
MTMGAWDFYQDRVGKWRWRHTELRSQAVSHGVSGYWTRNDCIADAIRHGYLTEGTAYTAGNRRPAAPAHSPLHR